MKKILSIAESATTGLLIAINLIWQWILNTALITIVAGLAVFLATQDIEQFNLVYYQDLFRGYALLASIAVAVMFILNRAISFAFRRSSGFSVEMLSRKDLSAFEKDGNKETEHYSGNNLPAASR